MKVKFNALNIGSVSFHQWDFGQTLEFDDVPDNSEVHFPVPNSSELAVVNVAGNTCAVPNSTLTMNDDTIKAYLYQKSANSGKTKKTIIIRIIPRPQPERYVYNPDDEDVTDYQDLKDRVEAVVTAAENGEYNGADGQDGRDGTNGVDGIDGRDGADGASAYEIAVDNGFVGTEQQWLASLKGETGATGPAGAKGDKGDPGETVYSPDEQCIGWWEWYDNGTKYRKPLYNRIIKLTMVPENTYSVSYTFTTEEIIDWDIITKWENGVQISGNYCNDGVIVAADYITSTKGFRIWWKHPDTGVDCFRVNFRYIKATDSAEIVS